MNNPWNEIQPPRDDVNARRVDSSHPLDLYWARDHAGKYLFIYEFEGEPGEEYRAPKLTGIDAYVVKAPLKPLSFRLVLALAERADWELFFSLSNDLVYATRSVQPSRIAVSTILRRLARWQEFLQKSRKKVLPEEAIKGLIGELLFLRNELTPVFGITQAVQFWQGPEEHPQDFNVGDTAVEIKCQSGTAQPTVHITSVEQLSPQLPTMYLCVYTLGRTTSDNLERISLPVLVSEIRQVLCDDGSSQLERFNDLLYSTGYIDSNEYDEFNYIETDFSVFSVREGFPRIQAEALHPGIVRLTYSIRLDVCEAFRSKPDWLRRET